MADKRTKELAPLQLSMFFANLGLVYHSGLTLAEGFETLKLSAQDATEESWLDALYQAANNGQPLAQALELGGGIPAYALQLVRIGEQTGRMEEVCAALASYYQKRDELEHSVRSALIYPLSMMIMVFVVVLVLLTQAMPVFDQVFAQLGFTMSGLSSLLLGLGQALNRSALVIGAVVVALVALGMLLWLLPAGRRVYKALFDGFPATAELSRRLSVQRFALAMATMLHSGLEADAALDMALPLVDNKAAAAKVREIQEEVGTGMSLITAIKNSKLFPPETLATLSMGFKTGNDAQAFDEIGRAITLSTERRIEALVATIEPTLVTVMCLLVGIILFSVMLPLLGVLTSI
ncbi:MAG: type II secretion system F family protein [Coriobacteriales bacterium]|jgi:type IV pilus assembly protein PilC|nr:type II secretion system F family protein [Coriobacteriales bacterium]